MSGYRTDFLSKTMAGIVLGLSLSMALTAVFAWITPGGPAAVNKFQFVMWLITPLWIGVFGLVYLFRDGRQSWLWLGGLNLLSYAAYFLIRYTAS
jgi:hypothetical protein